MNIPVISESEMNPLQPKNSSIIIIEKIATPLSSLKYWKLPNYSSLKYVEYDSYSSSKYVTTIVIKN